MNREGIKYARQLREMAPNLKVVKIRKSNALERCMVRQYFRGQDSVAFKKKFDMVEWVMAPFTFTC